MDRRVTEPPPRRVLIIGGAGVFGERLTTGILNTTPWHVIVAGRDAARLTTLRARLPEERVTAQRLDARRVTAADLRATGACVVVDAAGPFQHGDHRLARAAIEAGMHYIDLADARDFVAGFGVLEEAARAAGVVALTGASSTPALSNAALDALTAGWRRVDRVEIAISPGNRAPRGLSVVRAILSQAGQPARVLIGGEWVTRPGWGMTIRRALPGLGWRVLSLVETPDLDLMPARFRVRDTVVFRAGMELAFLHWGLWAASLLVRIGLLRSLTPLARPFRALAVLVERFGSDRGGMLVEATGLDVDGHPARATWSLVAEAGDGPFVPTLPALAALRALAAGTLAPPGAHARAGLLPLAAIEAEFVPYRITSARHATPAPPALYERVLGRAFASLPEAVRRAHQPGWGARFSGEAQVEGAEGILARMGAAVFRLPSAARRVPVSVEIVAEAGQERWVRRFGPGRFFSVLSASSVPGRVVERFGPFRFELDLLVGTRGVVGMPMRAWRLGPVPLPLALAPVSIATEHVDAKGRFCFDVEMRLPLGLGRLVRYRGWLVEAGASIPPGSLPDGPSLATLA